MDILFYTDTPNVGGAEKQMALLAKHLKPSGVLVNLAYGKYSKLRDHPELMREYAQVFEMRVAHKHDPRHHSQLWKIMRKQRPDLVHLHLWNPGACRWAFSAAAAMKMPIVATEHDPFELRGIKGWLKRFTVGLTTHTIAISRQGQRDLQDWYFIPNDRISVVHNGIETEEFSGPRQNSNGTTITCIAELHERKGHRYLLEAFLKLQQTYPNLQLQLVGTGPLEQELKQRYGSNPNIYFLGWRNDVPEILRNSDILVLPSLKEAFGLVVLEAMASGVAVVATDSGGVRDIIEHEKNGLLVPPADSDALAEAMRSLLTSPDQKRALEEAALKRAQEFSAERMADETLKIYFSVLQRTPSPSHKSSS